MRRHDGSLACVHMLVGVRVCMLCVPVCVCMRSGANKSSKLRKAVDGFGDLTGTQMPVVVQ